MASKAATIGERLDDEFGPAPSRSRSEHMNEILRRGRRILGCALTLSLGVVCMSTPADSARRTVKLRPKRAPVTAPTSVATTIAPTTTSTPGVPNAQITTFETSSTSARLALAPIGRTDLAAFVTVEAVGFDEGTRTMVFPAGLSDLAVGVSFNPDTKYTVRVKWLAVDGRTGVEDSRVVAPYFPQPRYRGPVPVAGPGWSVLFTTDFTPTRRNPCAPIDVFYDTTNQQLDVTDTIRSAVAQASDASGVPMQFVGAGRVRPSTPRVLVIDWVRGQTEWLGVARQANQADARGVVWRTTLSISLAASRGVARGRWGTVVLHELGHILGLQHSHDPTSLMFSPAESKESWPWVTTVFTEGDRRGLLAVNAGASGGCSPTIETADLWNGQQGP